MTEDAKKTYEDHRAAIRAAGAALVAHVETMGGARHALGLDCDCDPDDCEDAADREVAKAQDDVERRMDAGEWGLAWL